jgi:hypothetical protein
MLVLVGRVAYHRPDPFWSSCVECGFSGTGRILICRLGSVHVRCRFYSVRFDTKFVE